MKRLIIKKKNKFLCLPTLEKKNSVEEERSK